MKKKIIIRITRAERRAMKEDGILVPKGLKPGQIDSFFKKALYRELLAA